MLLQHPWMKASFDKENERAMLKVVKQMKTLRVKKKKKTEIFLKFMCRKIEKRK